MEVDSGDNDVVSFEVNGKFIGPDPTAVGGPLFNDPGSSVNYAGSDFTMGLPGTITRAYLIVDDNDDDGEHLYGEAIMLETHGGAAWGYVGYNAAHDGLVGTFDASATGIVGANDVHGEALDTDNGTDSTPFTLLPPNEWNTLFFVTPLADGQQRLCADCSVTVEVSQNGGGGTGRMAGGRSRSVLSKTLTANGNCRRWHTGNRLLRWQRRHPDPSHGPRSQAVE